MVAAPCAWVLALLLARLPKPPEKVVLECKYGSIVVDHRAHVNRRAPCQQCHGSGVITKIGHFGMVKGHERCRTCHRDEKRGPVECGGCHTGPKKDE